ncbi:ImmA/IrrE family metallo-endopeptidase [Streptomyces sp. E5N91]|uniref:ImmA/IrrE family metallo-endopeptidase n=1 Tax=Streptomyces sp. E5N91 TaxID=1851996 RepID=UPI000EF56789|nr:ImmA/IrrE family metallo-endopeptidase [Streptomyces sp. E5N91]
MGTTSPSSLGIVEVSASLSSRERRARLRDLRRKCNRLVAQLPGHHEFDISTLCELVSHQRGRPIGLAPMELDDQSLHGLLIAAPTTDLIVYQAATSKPHQEHIIVHEIAHILCGHTASDSPRRPIPLQLFPDLDPEFVRKALQRSGHIDRNEQEAETMASLILARTRWNLPQAPPPPAPEVAEVVSRLERIIGRNRMAS